MTLALALTASLGLCSWSALAHEGEEGHTHDDEGVEDEAPPVDEAVQDDSAQVDGDASAEASADKTEPAEPDAPATDASPTDDAPPDLAGHDHLRSSTLDDNSWRQNVRQREKQRSGADGDDFFDPWHFYFEIRFGPYWPEVDEEFGGSGPYEQTFGKKPRFYFGIELDWLPLHIPYVASIGPGFGWGYSRSKGRPLDDAGAPVQEADTSLWVMPMHASAIVRFDGPLRRWRVPIVPYAKIGFGFGIWSAGGPTGTSQVPSDDPDKPTKGRGNSMGMHLALGGAISLNSFDPSSAIQLRESTGIRYVNLWGEWMWANLDGVGSRPQMHIGSSTVVVGLAVDF
jgi:hypothetical protein